MAEVWSHLDLSKLSRIGVDKPARAQGHPYVTVFMDLEERRIEFATEGQDVETVRGFKAKLESHGGPAEPVREFDLDVPPAF